MSINHPIPSASFAAALTVTLSLVLPAAALAAPADVQPIAPPLESAGPPAAPPTQTPESLLRGMLEDLGLTLELYEALSSRPIIPAPAAPATSAAHAMDRDALERVYEDHYEESLPRPVRSVQFRCDGDCGTVNFTMVTGSGELEQRYLVNVADNRPFTIAFDSPLSGSTVFRFEDVPAGAEVSRDFIGMLDMSPPDEPDDGCQTQEYVVTRARSLMLLEN